MSLEWKAEFSVGVSEIDAQHKRLFAIINQMDDIAKSKKGKLLLYYRDLVKLLDELGDYAVTHFYDEEMAMEECGCPDFEAHKMKHEVFSDEMANIKENLVSDPKFKENEEKLAEVVDKLNKFLGTWLTKHILIEDMKYKNKIKKV